jgi:hypothetical protein
MDSCGNIVKPHTTAMIKGITQQVKHALAHVFISIFTKLETKGLSQFTI